tara:strand:+ start:1226 stop:2056 length:831 start_codon:yes stop_codon:yes gene_type:complete
MGGGGSTTQNIEQTFNFSAISENVTNIVTNNTQETGASGANIQGMKVNFGEIIGCDVNLSQRITSSTMASSEFSVEEIAELQTSITNDMQAAATAALEKNSQMGSELGALMSGDMNQDIKTAIDMEIKNLVTNNITTNNLTSTVSEQVNIQDGELNVKRYDCTVGSASLDFSQDVVSEVKAESVMSTLKEAIANNKVLNKMAASADSTATQKQGGIAEVMDSVFGGIADVIGTSQQGAMAGSAASVCICCVLVIGMVMMFMSPAGQNMGRTAMTKF